MDFKKLNEELQQFLEVENISLRMDSIKTFVKEANKILAPIDLEYVPGSHDMFDLVIRGVTTTDGEHIDIPYGNHFSEINEITPTTIYSHAIEWSENCPNEKNLKKWLNNLKNPKQIELIRQITEKGIERAKNHPSKKECADFIKQANKLLQGTLLAYHYTWDTTFQLQLSPGNELNISNPGSALMSTTKNALNRIIPMYFEENKCTKAELNTCLDTLKHPETIGKINKLINKDKKIIRFRGLKPTLENMVTKHNQIFVGYRFNSHGATLLFQKTLKTCIDYLYYSKSYNYNDIMRMLFPNITVVRNEWTIPTQDCVLTLDSDKLCIYPVNKYKQEDIIPHLVEFIGTNIDNILNILTNYKTIGEKQKPKPKNIRAIWRLDPEACIYTKTKATGTDFNEYGDAVIVQIYRADEWETGEITDFEHAYWFPQVEPDIYDMGEGNEYDISPNRKGSCSLQDALKAVSSLGITPPPYNVLTKFLKGIEDWVKTGTLDSYLQKHETELKQLCS